MHANTAHRLTKRTNNHLKHGLSNTCWPDIPYTRQQGFGHNQTQKRAKETPLARFSCQSGNKRQSFYLVAIRLNARQAFQAA